MHTYNSRKSSSISFIVYRLEEIRVKKPLYRGPDGRASLCEEFKIMVNPSPEQHHTSPPRIVISRSKGTKNKVKSFLVM